MISIQIRILICRLDPELSVSAKSRSSLQPLTTDKIVQIPVSVGKPMRVDRDHNMHLYQHHLEDKVVIMWMGARRLTSINTLGLFISEDTPEKLNLEN